MAVLGSDIWMPLNDAVRPHVLLVAAGAEPQVEQETMQVARQLSRRARVAVVLPNGGRLKPPVTATAGVLVHRFVSRVSLGLWLAAHAGRYDAVYVHGSGRLERLALRGLPRVLPTPDGDSPEEIADRSYEGYVRLTTPVQAT